MGTKSAVAASALAAGAMLVGGASPAGATPHSRGPVLIGGGHYLWAWGSEQEVGNGLEYWYDIRTAETFPTLDSACNYSGWLGELHPPNQRLVFAETKSHSGCSLFLAYFDWQNWESNYPENVRLRAKWRSTETSGEWKLIGDLTD